QALIATEDVRFYRHDGVDLFSMPRVFFKTLLLGDESSGGGSTLTQQLAKNLYPRREYGWFSLPINKIREAILAQRLEGVYSKEEILKHYLNTVPFGDNAYGIEVACRRFFSVSAADILPQDAALLVGMLKATSAYNPRTDPARSVQRRNVVLRQMYRNGVCTQAFADSLAALPVALRYQPESHNLGLAPYFRERLRQELDRWCKSYTRPDGSHPNLYTDGLKIYVTIHSRMQQYAEEAVAEHMKKVQQRFDTQWKGKSRLKESEKQVNAIWERSARYRQLKAAGASVQELDSACLRPVRMQVFTWQGPRDTLLSPRDSILHSEYMLHAGFMALDPASGHVRAWVGGIQHAFYQYDHVDSRRQCGSVFKPFVYAAALESGISPCEYISNERTTFEGYGNWAPRNADSDYGGEYSMESALTHSVNVVTVNLLMQTGIPKVTDLARRLGLQGELPESPALALGAGQASLREMVAAYAAFVNGGQHVAPLYLLRVEDADGTLLKGMEQIAVGPQVLSDSTALLIRHMLTSVVDRGTAHGLRSRFGLKGQMAGKTGTTQSQADGWFIGVTPGLAAGAWVGANNPAIHFHT
ncbi:MAG: penicillin-binding protein, partial [Bacteroidetes bacterium]